MLAVGGSPWARVCRPKPWQIAGLAGLIGWIMHESLLNRWGDIGAIVGGAIAILLFLGGLWTWLRRWWWAIEIDHALHIVEPAVHSDPSADGQSAELRVGLQLRNGSTIPLSFSMVKCDVTLASHQSDISGKQPLRADLAPSKPTGWYRDLIVVPFDELPAKLTIGYAIHYGRQNQPFRRCLSGVRETDSRFNGRAGSTVFADEKVADRDRRLPRWRGSHHH